MSWLTGTLFVKGAHRALGKFEYHADGDRIALRTIPGTSDHVGFLKAHNENEPFTLLLGEGNRLLDLAIIDVKPSGDRFELSARGIGEPYRRPDDRIG